MDRAIAPLTGRVLIGLIFFLSGMQKIFNFEQTQGYMANHGMTATEFFLVAAIIVELGGAMSLFFGYYARKGALLLFLYLIPVTLVFHAFWQLEGMERQTQIINFLKNLAIMGGLLYVFRVGAMAFSLDRKLHTRDETPALGGGFSVHGHGRA